MTIIDLMGYMSATLFVACYVPQIIRTHRLKSVDDISVWLWVFSACAYLSGLGYGIGIGSSPLIVNYTLGLCCNVIILSQWAVYRDPRRDHARRQASKIISETMSWLKRRGDDPENRY